MGYVGKKPTDAPLTSSDIGDGQVTAAKLGTDAVETAKVKDLNVTVAKLPATVDVSSKTVTLPASVGGLGTGIDVTSQITGVVPAANLGSGTASSSTYLAGDSTYKTISEYDDDKIQSNIALLGFKTAVNGSLAKYSLQDQIIDEYEDATGIDAGNSTNEELSSGVYKGVSTGFPVGGDSTDTSVTGYTTIVCGTSTSSGSISINNTADVDILVVAGGATGGHGYGGGGGAGGLIYKAAHELTPNTYDWVVGAGGAALTGAISNVNGNDGEDSTWTINGGAVEFTAKGGGGGGSTVGPESGNVGGSAGGSRYYAATTGGVANQTSQSGDSGTYGFGNNGGNSIGAPNYNSGGGGGAGSAGTNATTGSSGAGGTGKDMSAIFGTAVGDSGWFASGGGGGYISNGSGAGGTASAGGGSDGGMTYPDGPSSDADANTGGGSGGNGSGGGDVGAGGSGIILIRSTDSSPITGSAEGGDLTLQSTDTTAMTEPNYADMVILMENNAGTATINTDIKGWISKDSGSTFTQGTLVDEGTWGTNKKILAFHDLDISAQSGTSMCYKITTHNQDSSLKKTRIHATSIGWKA
jgi:hypothetical protein